MQDDEVKELADELRRVFVEKVEGKTRVVWPCEIYADTFTRLARVALEYVEERITESVNAYIRAINKMYAIEAEKIITGEVKFEIKEQP